MINFDNNKFQNQDCVLLIITKSLINYALRCFYSRHFRKPNSIKRLNCV